jgi:multidrug efflux pump subunit AcrA (membrane-fusion protein)
LDTRKITAPIDGVVGFANNQVGDLVGPSTGPLTTMSQIDPIKAVVTAGEGRSPISFRAIPMRRSATPISKASTST